MYILSLPSFRCSAFLSHVKFFPSLDRYILKSGVYSPVSPFSHSVYEPISNGASYSISVPFAAPTIESPLVSPSYSAPSRVTAATAPVCAFILLKSSNSSLIMPYSAAAFLPLPPSAAYAGAAERNILRHKNILTRRNLIILLRFLVLRGVRHLPHRTICVRVSHSARND